MATLFRISMTFVGMAVLLSPIASGALAQSHHWVGNVSNGHFYALTNVTGTWHDAEAEALTLGGHLATIRNQEENDWLVRTFLVGQSFCDQIAIIGPWIGLTDETVEGTFVWSSGEPLTYTNWKSGQPDDAGNEDYVHFNGGSGGSDGRWNDLRFDRADHCASALPGIIELTFVPPDVSGIVCDIHLEQTVYTTGEAIIVDVVQVGNLSAQPRAVEIGLWLERPEALPVRMIGEEDGADGSLIFAPGFTQDFGPVALGTVGPEDPEGTYGYHCRLIDPVTKAWLTEDLNPFEVVE